MGLEEDGTFHLGNIFLKNNAATVSGAHALGLRKIKLAESTIARKGDVVKGEGIAADTTVKEDLLFGTILVLTKPTAAAIADGAVLSITDDNVEDGYTDGMVLDRQELQDILGAIEGGVVEADGGSNLALRPLYLNKLSDATTINDAILNVKRHTYQNDGTVLTEYNSQNARSAM